MMKRCLVCLMVLAGVICLTAQDVIENPKRPLNKSAGRTLILKEELRVKGDTDRFFFRRPGDIAVTESGEYFVGDQDQIMKFTADGRFVKNLFKKGQGPGEIAGNFTMRLQNQLLYITDFMGRKALALDLDGNLVEELSFSEHGYTGFYGKHGKHFIFTKPFQPPFEKMTGLTTMYRQYFLMAEDGIIVSESEKFPVRWFYAQNIGLSWDPFNTVVSQNGEFFFMNNTQEYLIKVLRVQDWRMIRQFRRAYWRVRSGDSDNKPRTIRGVKFPQKKHEDDIKDMIVVGDKLWIRTSTENTETGVLYDIFSFEGTYLDCVHIRTEGRVMTITPNYVFILEQDAEENFELVKYRIVKK
ncbi:MAG: 6-bladed beta-propeller [Pseudomonadota bacterium]